MKRDPDGESCVEGVDSRPGLLDARALATGLVAIAAGIAVLELLVLFRGALHARLFSGLEIYQQATQYWVSGGGLYDFVFDHPDMPGYGFTYPPFAALLFLPMVAVPRDVLVTVWTIGTLLTLVALSLALAVHDTAGDKTAVGQGAGRSRIAAETAFGTCVLLLSYPVIEDLGQGQISILIAALAFLDVAAVVPARLRGILAGLAASIKLTPLVFLGYFLVTRQWRAATMMAGVFAGAGALGFLVAPSESITYWGQKVFDTSRVGQEWWTRNKSLLGLVARWDRSGQAEWWAWLGLCLVVTVAAMARARGHYLRQEHLQAALVIGSLSVVVTPISWPHHQVWMVLVAIWLATSLRPLRVLLAAVLLLAFLPLPVIWLAEPVSLSQRFASELPTVTFILVTILGLPRDAGSLRPTQPASTSAYNLWHP